MDTGPLLSMEVWLKARLEAVDVERIDVGAVDVERIDVGAVGVERIDVEAVGVARASRIVKMEAGVGHPNV